MSHAEWRKREDLNLFKALRRTGKIITFFFFVSLIKRMLARKDYCSLKQRGPKARVAAGDVRLNEAE